MAQRVGEHEELVLPLRDTECQGRTVDSALYVGNKLPQAHTEKNGVRIDSKLQRRRALSSEQTIITLQLQPTRECGESWECRQRY